MKRYDIEETRRSFQYDSYRDMVENHDGDWVLYAHAERRIRELEAKLEGQCGVVDAVMKRIDRLIDENAELRAKLEAAEKEMALHRRWHRKPTHGPCCTCQRCGLDYDTCRCSLDDVADENAELRAKL